MIAILPLQHNCQDQGCNETGSACFYPDNETEDPDHYFCYTHAFEHGFCYGCGRFWGGVEDFDFAEFWGNVHGYCPDCSEEINSHSGGTEDDDTDDDDDYPEFSYAVCEPSEPLFSNVE